jgi:hypothetical protein
MNGAARKLTQLPLLSQNGRWAMRFRGKRAEFVDRHTALRAAILEAFENSRNGTPTQVVCVDEHLSIEIAWTYGVDPDPPAALTERPPSSDRRPLVDAPRRQHRAARHARVLADPASRAR